MKASVVIPTYNRREILARTLPTILTQDFPSEQYEVIVVVDGSTDGTLELLQSLRPACSLRVLQQENRGQAAARNAGLSAARGQLILFLDDDLLCDRALVREHVAGHVGDDVRVVFGPVLVAPESSQTLAGDWMRACTDNYLSRIHRQRESQWPHDAMVFANSSAPRSILLACDGFDERFACALEDNDLGLRLWKMGVRFHYQATAVASQLFSKSARDLVEADAHWYGRNEVLLCRKHPDYRPHSSLADLSEGPAWKRGYRQFVARLPVSLEPLLRVPFWFAERLRSIPLFRKVGIRLLQRRQRIVMLRAAVREAGSWEALQAEFGFQLPVLLYHHVGPPQAGTYPELTVSPEQFERQVHWLAQHDYVGIRPSDWLAWCRQGNPLPNKPVLFSFDDAYADNARYALPVLRRYGFGAVVFVVTGQVGGTNTWDQTHGSGTLRLMTAQEIRQWAEQGIEFGAHSRTHTDMTTVAGPELEAEVAGSGADLADILQSRVRAFAYPYGSYNEAVRRRVRCAFDLAFTTEEGLNDLRTQLHLLRRTMVLPYDSWIDLTCRLRLGWSPVHYLRTRIRLRSRLTQVTRRLLGHEQ